MDAEFDSFADNYLETHAENLKIAGDDPDYFARAKAEVLRRRWTRLGLAEPTAILDFGAGVGSAWPHLAAVFPDAAITGLDVSAKSLAIAEHRFPGLARTVCYDGDSIPLPPDSFDLVYVAASSTTSPPTAMWT